ncbi:MAG: GNAT family N-acetyltransferase [Methanophagales archaeon]|nr:GNAT family N-acetyltransferase [Methanophagales archaeon]
MNSMKWNEIVNHNNSKIYHHYEWGTLLNEVHGHKLIYLEEDKGVFPLAHVKSHIFGNRLISLPFADYGGPCTNDKKTADILATKAEGTAKELDVDFIEIRSPGEEYFDIFEKHGFVRKVDYFTFKLPLDKKVEDSWKNIGRKNRNMVRKAGKNGVEVVEAKNKLDLRAFYGLYLKTMKKLGSPPQPYKFFETIWGLFHLRNLIILLAKCNGRFIGGSLFFLHRDTIHHAYNCSSKDYSGLGQNNLMQWYIIKWGNKNGFKYLDFGRTRENAGNVLFKRRWGGELFKMPYFYKFYKKELREREETKYEGLSQLWSKYMPEFVANRIGPWIIKQIG